MFKLPPSKIEKEKSFEKFDNKLTSKLKAASNAKGWSDLLPIIGEIYAFLKANNDYDFNKISDKLLLGKRLAQCLNPECPGGLHEITIEVYEILLKNIVTRYKDKLMDNLHIYASGLFPFFPNATITNKQKFLDKIVKGIFVKLNIIELKICLPGLLSSLIPGLDDNNEETSKQIYSSFDSLVKMDERNFFGVYWMLLLRCKHLRKSGIKYLVAKIKKYDEIISLDKKEQKEIIEKQLPNLNTTVTNALCEIIKDNDVPLLRDGMDFIISRLPLIKENSENGENIWQNDSAKITLIISVLSLLIKNEGSTIRRLKNWILGLESADDEPNFESEDMKYKMGLVIEAFKKIFEDKRNESEVIQNNILIFENFLGLEEFFVKTILSSISFLVLKSVVNYLDKNVDFIDIKPDDPVVSKATTFFKKNDKYFESLWNSLALSIIEEGKKNNLNSDNMQDIDDIIRPLKFCLTFIDVKSNEDRMKYYIPIITNILSVIRKISIDREKFKNIKKIGFIALAFIKSLQEKKFQKNEEEENNKEKKLIDNKDTWEMITAESSKKSVLVEINDDDDEQNEEDNIFDVYEINDEFDLKNLMNYDKNLLENLSNNISMFQDYYIQILNELINPSKQENKNKPITRAEIAFFRQLSELMIRLQEYNQKETNEIPRWVKYIEKIIFIHKNNSNYNALQIEAANILLDLNLSFDKKDKESVFTKIKTNFKSEEIDTNIIEINTIIDFAKKMKVKSNCFELLLAKFYLLTNKQTDLNNNMEILYKIFYIDKERFADIIDATLNTTENLYENIKIFNNFWKSVNDYYPNEKLFKKETIFKMINFLEDKNPTLRHLSKTWLNQANQNFSKIIDPILMELINNEILFSTKNNEANIEETEFLDEFDVSKILDAFNKLKNIIINSQIMPFFLKTDINKEIFDLIKFSKYTDIKLSYLQTIICIVLHFTRTKAKEGEKEEFIKDVYSLNATSTEFLEFLLKNINDYNFLITNSKKINETILYELKKSLQDKDKDKDEVMAVQYLDVLKSLYFNYPLQIIKIPNNKVKYIDILLNPTLEKIIKDGLSFEHFYIRDHFISFTTKLVESFFNAISIEDKTELKKFYSSCNKFIEPLSKSLEEKVKFENNIKIDTEKFSHYDDKHNNIIYKNYCEEYREYKTYDEGEIISILNGINAILLTCFKNQIQDKNKELSTDKGIKFFYIDIPFIKKKTVTKMDFKGNWLEHKKKLADDNKNSNDFVKFMNTMFDFVDENPNREIKDMSTSLYHNQIFALLKSFLTIWINQSDKYERYDYCLNPNGILAFLTNDPFKNAPFSKALRDLDSINTNPIKSVIISIAKHLFITDSVKFISNILKLWSEDCIDDNQKRNKDKQFKLSIIELMISMDIPMDVILCCIGIYLQKSFANNSKVYIKNKSHKCYETPIDVSIKEAKIFHFIYSYISLNPSRGVKKNDEIYKELINIISMALNESKIINSFCWLYEILQLTLQRFQIEKVESREIKNGVENQFTNLTNKLMDAAFNQKTDSKYINDSKLILPFLPHVYTYIITECYKDDDLYQKNLEGNKISNQNFNKKTFKTKLSLDNIESTKTFLNEDNSGNVLRLKTKLSLSEKFGKTNKLSPQKEEASKVLNKKLEEISKLPKTNNESYNQGNDLNKNKVIGKKDLDNIYQFFAFITLKENFYLLLKNIFGDNPKNVSKYYNDILSKLLSLIKKGNKDDRYLVEYAHIFLDDLAYSSPDNVSSCGKTDLVEYIKSEKLFQSTPSELHHWANIIRIFSDKYKDILKDLLNTLSDKNLIVKKNEKEKSEVLRRISFVIFSCENDHFLENFSQIKTRTKKLLRDFGSGDFLEKEIFLLLRVLFLKFSHDAVMQMIRDLWPIIFTELLQNINNYIQLTKPNCALIFEPFKFVELLSLVNIGEFSLYQWIFMLDTFDIEDCNAKNSTSLCKKLITDQENLFKPLALEIMKKNISDINIIKGDEKAKNELFIDAKDEAGFRNQLYKFFYSIGDMNSYKVEANLDQIAENIEKEFVEKKEEINIQHN